MDNIEVDLLGECYITCEDYLDDRITRVDFTQIIRDEIKKDKFPKNIRECIEIIEPHLKIFEEYMEHILELNISEGYPTVDDFFDAEERHFGDTIRNRNVKIFKLVTIWSTN